MAPVIGFASMTHLGLNSAAAAAEKGFEVIAYDADGALTANLTAGKLHVEEPGLARCLSRNAGRMTYTSALSDLTRADVTYVAMDVPTDDTGTSDTAPLEALLTDVTPALKKGSVLVLLSQVKPGFSARIRPLCEAAGVMYHYQVETLIFGQALHRALEPERIIIGCTDPAAALPADYATFLAAFGCPLLPMRFESAELTKIAINLFLVSTVATTNALAEVCEATGADWGEIAPALKLDKRIGPHAYLAPGLGLAGGNLERDLASIQTIADANDCAFPLVRVWQDDSRYRKDWPLRTLSRLFGEDLKNRHIAMLGVAYKAGTHSVKNAPSLACLAGLTCGKVTAYDPVVDGAPYLPSYGTQGSDPLAACREADAVVVFTPWDEIKRLNPADIAAAMAGTYLLDPFGVFDKAACEAAGLTYLTLGQG